jgi:hypothetical protein
MNYEDNSIEETLTQDTDADIEIDLSEEDDIETVDWKAIALKNQKAYKDQKTRAEIAEGKVKTKPQAKPETYTTTQSTLTVKDGFALAKANVNDDDIDEVLEYANFKKISVADALKSTVVKNLIAEKEEYRTSQNASTTTTARRATPKLTDDTILDNARQGKVDDSEEGIKRLFNARMGIK